MRMPCDSLMLRALLCLQLFLPVVAKGLDLDKGSANDTAPCSRHEVAVQVLGSGGPMHGQSRGAPAYLVWINHKPAAVIDMGGDTPTALVKAGVGANRIGTILISHIHPDHVSGLPDFLWGEITANRSSSLSIVGPDGGQGIADIRTFLERLFGEHGAFAGMQTLLAGGEFPVNIQTVATGQKTITTVSDRDGISVFAYPVVHGKAPAVAYRVDGSDFRIVFGGDQTYLDPGFAEFADRADLLILHATVNAQVNASPLAHSVGSPQDLGLTARHAHAKEVVLAHLMLATSMNQDAHLWSLSNIDSVSVAVERAFGGRVKLANDLECFPVRH